MVSKSFKITVTQEQSEEIRRLLNNGGDVPVIDINTACVDRDSTSEVYISRSHLMRFLAELEETAISDQKQEAYKGIQKVLALLR